MDGKLQKRQSDMTFQMKVLLYKNKDFLAEHRLRMKELASKEAEERTKKLLEFHVSNDAIYDVEDGEEEVDLDSETDDLLELYYQPDPAPAETALDAAAPQP
jgi:hypothetical protein